MTSIAALIQDLVSVSNLFGESQPNPDLLGLATERSDVNSVIEKFLL